MREPKPLNDLLQSWMKKSGKENLFHEFEIKDQLKEILGNALFSKIKKLSWVAQDNLLLVVITDPLLKNELGFATESIRSKINSNLSQIEIRKIVWV